LIVKEGVENSKRFFLHIPNGHLKRRKELGKTIRISVNMAHNQWHHCLQAIKEQDLPMANI